MSGLVPIKKEGWKQDMSEKILTLKLLNEKFGVWVFLPIPPKR